MSRRTTESGRSTADDLRAENAELKKELAFQKKLVAASQSQLRLYQIRYPDLVAGEGKRDATLESLTTGEPLPPWVLESRYMSPLLVAYESRIHVLEQRQQDNLSDLQRVRENVKLLVQRNEELESALEQGLSEDPGVGMSDSVDPNLSRSTMGPGAHSDSVLSSGPQSSQLLTHTTIGGTDSSVRSLPDAIATIRELEQALALYKQSADIHRQAESAARKELASVRADVEERKEELLLLNQQLAHLHQVQKIKNELAARLKETSEQLVQCIRERDAVTRKHTELQAAFESTSQQFENAKLHHRAQTNKLRDTVSALETQLGQLHQPFLEYKRQAEEASVVHHRLQDQVHALSTELEVQKGAYTRLENNEKQAGKDHALAMSQQEARLKESIANVYQKDKAREEKLENEARNLQLSCASLESRRAAAERQLELMKEQVAQLSRTQKQEYEALEAELQRALQEAVKLKAERELAVENAERAESDRLDMKNWCDRERQSILDLVETSRAETARITADLAVTEEQRFNLDQKLKDTIIAHEREHADSQRRITELLTQLRQTQEDKVVQLGDLEKRLEEAYRMHEESEQRAGELLQEQAALRDRWKEETRATILQFEASLRASQQKMVRLMSRNAELETHGKGLADTRAVLEADLAAQRQTVTHLRKQVDAAQRKRKKMRLQMSQWAAEHPRLVRDNAKLRGIVERIVGERNQARVAASQAEQRFQSHRHLLQQMLKLPSTNMPPDGSQALGLPDINVPVPLSGDGQGAFLTAGNEDVGSHGTEIKEPQHMK